MFGSRMVPRPSGVAEGAKNWRERGRAGCVSMEGERISFVFFLLLLVAREVFDSNEEEEEEEEEGEGEGNERALATAAAAAAAA